MPSPFRIAIASGRSIRSITGQIFCPVFLHGKRDDAVSPPDPAHAINSRARFAPAREAKSASLNISTIWSSVGSRCPLKWRGRTDLSLPLHKSNTYQHLVLEPSSDT